MDARTATLALTAALVAVPLVTGPASACSYVGLEDLSVLAWLADGRLVANHGYDVGVVDPAEGVLQVRASTFPSGEVAVSPDGRFLAFSTGARDPTPDASEAACELPYGGTQVLDLGSGDVVTLVDGASPALAAGTEALYVLSLDGDELLAYPWGSWSDPDTIELPRTLRERDVHVARIVTDPTGMRLAAVGLAGGDSVVAVVSSDGSLLAQRALDGTVETAALSPGGTHLAVAVRHAEERRVALYAIEDGALEHRSGFTAEVVAYGFGAGTGLVWNEHGLAVAERHQVSLWPDPLEADGFSTYATETNATGGLAWSPDGATLAVGTEGGLVLLDPSLAEVGGFSIDRRGAWTEGRPLDPPGPVNASDGAGGVLTPAPGLVLAVGVLAFLAVLRASWWRRA